jgi:anthraniloyl-CoA monooxygenase
MTRSSRQGAVKPSWEGMDAPLDSGAWPLIAPSSLAWNEGNQVPREMTRGDMDDIVEEFAESTRRAAVAGFDLLELHFAHGFLISSFLTPVSNQRTDEYGGSTENRLRFPLEVFDAVRAAWPADRPISVRLSATDWVDDGITEAESIVIAQAFADHGADILDVSTGETTPKARPAYGRSYQTPYADRIRNLVGIPTIAVGAISSWDDVNTNIAAGRADLCAVGRPHLYDPNWTLHAAAEQGYAMAWPDPYLWGSSKPAAGRSEDPKPRLVLVPEETAVVDRPSRWRP